MVIKHHDRDRNTVEARRYLEIIRSSAQNKLANVYNTYGEDVVSKMLILVRQLKDNLPAWEASNYNVYQWVHALGITWEVEEGVTHISYDGRQVIFRDNHWSTGTRVVLGDILDVIGIKLPLGGCKVNPFSFCSLIDGLQEIITEEGAAKANEVVSDHLLDLYKEGAYDTIPQSRFYKVEVLYGELTKIDLRKTPSPPETTSSRYGYQEIDRFHTRKDKISLTQELIEAHGDKASLKDTVDNILRGLLDESCRGKLSRLITPLEKKAWKAKYSRVIQQHGHYPTGNTPAERELKERIFSDFCQVADFHGLTMLQFCSTILGAVDKIMDKQVY